MKLRRRISRPREALLDHLIGQREELRWDVNAKGFGGLQVQDEIEPGRLLDRKVAGLLAVNTRPA